MAAQQHAPELSALTVTSRDQAEALMALYAATGKERYANALRDWGLNQTPPGHDRQMTYRHGSMRITGEREVLFQIQPLVLCIHSDLTKTNCRN